MQLATYALLQQGREGSGGEPQQVAYVALERHRVCTVAQEGDIGDIVTRTAERLQQLFGELRAGAGLPAQGVDAVCRFCEMRGLCRRDYWEPDS